MHDDTHWREYPWTCYWNLYRYQAEGKVDMNSVPAFSSYLMIFEWLMGQTHMSFRECQISMEQDGITITYLVGGDMK
jgi:hypothetical protein